MTRRRLSFVANLMVVLLVGAYARAQQLELPGALNVASPNAREVAGLFWLVLGFSALVLLVVVVFMGAAIIRGRREQNMEGEPPQTHGNLTLEVTWTLVPLIILGILLVPTLSSLVRLDGMSAPEGALEVNVVGQQFWWEMSYPDKDIITANEMVVPVGRPVRINLVAKDVMHSFWVSQLAGKTDLVPGNQRTMWFTPERTGVYHGQCTEICGDSHANMRFRVVALESEDFDAWVSASQQPAEEATNPMNDLAREGEQLFISKGCVNCHAVQGVNVYNRVGPDLSHVGSRTSIGAGIFTNERDNLVRWLRYVDTVKPGVLMPNLGLDEDEATKIAAYLEGLTLPGFDMRAALEGVPGGLTEAARAEGEEHRHHE